MLELILCLSYVYVVGDDDRYGLCVSSRHAKFASYMSLFMFFFFSSRRRHTRFKCDWSSDVCSSDLNLPAAFPATLRRMNRQCIPQKRFTSVAPIVTAATLPRRSHQAPRRILPNTIP